MESGGEVAHSCQEAVNGASVFEVANEIDVQSLQGALRLIDGVEVEHRLAGMLVGAVAGIDDGYGRYFAGILGRSLQIMPHHDDVGVVGYHHNRVLEGLTLRAAGHLGVGKTDDFCSKTVGSSLEAETCACTGLKEQCCHNSPLQQAAIGMLLELLRHSDEILYLFAGVMSYGYETSIFHCFTIFSCKDTKKRRMKNQ